MAERWSVPEHADRYLDVVVADVGSQAIVPWLLMASLGYYHLDVSLVSDSCYDEMWQTVLAQPWLLTQHRHGCFLTLEGARAGSLFDLAVEGYPHHVRGGLRAGLELTQQRPDRERMESVMRADFSPPERIWDVYHYGRGVTWRQHLESLR